MNSDSDRKSGPEFVLLCYANQPVERVGERYLAKHRNFVDLLAQLVSTDSKHRLIVPIVEEDDSGQGFQLEVPSAQVCEIGGYTRHFGALMATIANFRKVRKSLHALQRDSDVPVVLLSTVPSSMFCVQMLFGNRDVKYVGFARGDTRRTLKHIYGDSIRGRLSLLLVNIFLRICRRSQRRGKLLVFGVGEEVLESLDLTGGETDVLYPLLHRSELPDQESIGPREPGPVRFLSLGRLSNEKSIREMLAAARMLIDDGIDFRLSFAGFGTLESELKKALEGELGSHVSFLGAVEPGKAIFDLLLQHDVLLIPSKTEGVPRTVAEAAAARRLVLCSAVGSIPTTFGDGVRYVDAPTPEAIAEGMRWVIDHPEAWEGYIDEASEQVEEMTLEAATRKVFARTGEWLAGNASKEPRDG